MIFSEDTEPLQTVKVNKDQLLDSRQGGRKLLPVVTKIRKLKGVPNISRNSSRKSLSKYTKRYVVSDEQVNQMLNLETLQAKLNNIDKYNSSKTHKVLSKFASPNTMRKLQDSGEKISHENLLNQKMCIKLSFAIWKFHIKIYENFKIHTFKKV